MGSNPATPTIFVSVRTRPHVPEKAGEFVVRTVFRLVEGEYIDIKTGALLAGNLSARALGLVTEWTALHRKELLESWELAKKHADLKKVAPLE